MSNTVIIDGYKKHTLESLRDAVQAIESGYFKYRLYKNPLIVQCIEGSKDSAYMYGEILTSKDVAQWLSGVPEDFTTSVTQPFKLIINEKDTSSKSKVIIGAVAELLAKQYVVKRGLLNIKDMHNVPIKNSDGLTIYFESYETDMLMVALTNYFYAKLVRELSPSTITRADISVENENVIKTLLNDTQNTARLAYRNTLSNVSFYIGYKIGADQALEMTDDLASKPGAQNIKNYYDELKDILSSILDLDAEQLDSKALSRFKKIVATMGNVIETIIVSKMKSVIDSSGTRGKRVCARIAKEKEASGQKNFAAMLAQAKPFEKLGGPLLSVSTHESVTKINPLVNLGTMGDDAPSQK